jgi:hypothetical protein
MISSSFSRRPGATAAGIFSMALASVLLLCGAGSVPIENFTPQGAMQADFNAGGHSLTNANTIVATNSITAPTVVSTNYEGNGAGLTNVVTYGTTAGTAAQGNDSRIAGALQTSSLGSGVQSGLTYAPNVANGFVQFGSDGGIYMPAVTSGMVQKFDKSQVVVNGAQYQNALGVRSVNGPASITWLDGTVAYNGGGATPADSYYETGAMGWIPGVSFVPDQSGSIGSGYPGFNYYAAENFTTIGGTTMTFVGTTAAGSPTVTMTTSPALGTIFPGAKLTGTGIVSSPATTVSSISGSTITMSQNATAGGSVTIAVTGNPASIGFRWLQQGVDTTGAGTAFVREDILGATTVGGRPGPILFYNPVAGDGANGTIPPALLTLAGDGSSGVTVGSTGVNAPLTVNGNLTVTGTTTLPGYGQLAAADTWTGQQTIAANVAGGTGYASIQNNQASGAAAYRTYNDLSNFTEFGFGGSTNANTLIANQSYWYSSTGGISICVAGSNTIRLATGGVDSSDTRATVSSTAFTSTVPGTFPGLTLSGFLTGSGSAPSISAGTGAGTSPTVSIAGTNLAGEITITTGTSPSASATVATITFAGSAAFPNHAEPILQPMNAAAHALSGAASVYCPQGGTTSWTVGSDTTALPASTTLTYRYQVAGY